MNEIDQLLMQFGLGAYFVHKIEDLKHSPRFGWITPYTTGLTKLVSAVYGFFIAAGITIAFTPDGDGTASLTLAHIPITAAMGWQALTHAFGQYWGMKAYYHMGVKSDAHT